MATQCAAQGRTMSTHLLASLFNPKHIILVGASERPNSLGERFLSTLIQAPFSGKLTPVNLRHKTVAGIKSYHQIQRIPDNADLAVVLTPPDTYDTVIKACIKKDIQNIILIQDWNQENEAQLIQETQQTVKKFEKTETNIFACTLAGINLTQHRVNLNHTPLTANRYGDFSVVSMDPASSHTILSILNAFNIGLSAHVSMQPQINGENYTKIVEHLHYYDSCRKLIIEFNPHTELQTFFNKLHRASKNKTVVLYAPNCHTTDEYTTVRALAKRSGCLFAPNPETLTLYIRALNIRLSSKIKNVKLITNQPYGWLHTAAEQCGIHLNHNATTTNSVNTPALLYRTQAESALNQNQTDAVLIALAPVKSEYHSEISNMLHTLQQSTTKPILFSHGFSDGLLHFQHTSEAINTIVAHNKIIAKKQPIIAKPWPCNLKTPDIQTAESDQQNISKLIKSLHLPEYSEHPSENHSIRFRYTYHSDYGFLLHCSNHYTQKTYIAPFSTIHAENIKNTFHTKLQTKEICQLLYSLNTCALNLPTLQYAEFHSSGNGLQTTEILLQENNSTSPLAAVYPQQNIFMPSENSDGLVTIRSIHPEDAFHIQKLIRNLSDESRYNRFMAHIKELSPSALAAISNFNPTYEGAFGAFNSSGELLGISHFSSVNHDPNTCEFAICIADHMQGKGLAKPLMDTILERAKQQGYRQMTADILQSNTAMVKFMQKTGFTLTPSEVDNQLYQAERRLFPQTNNSKTKFKKQILAFKS